MEEQLDYEKIIPNEPKEQYLDRALREVAEDKDALEIIERVEQQDEIDRKLNRFWAIEQLGLTQEEITQMNDRASALEREELDRNDYERRKDNVKKFGSPVLKGAATVSLL